MPDTPSRSIIPSVFRTDKGECFLALNIEPEEDSEEEIDDTKEIQIEEALKLYQSALKLHSQGPGFFDEAEAAYDALFKSEIFTYIETLSDSKRTELYGDAYVDVDDEFEEPTLVASAAPAGGTDGAPSTLPQILYLSFKNHGQFLLDRLTHQLILANSESTNNDGHSRGFRGSIHATAMETLTLFAEALERDDSDLDLWRRTARICGLLGSRRVARFCLEAVVEAAREELDARLAPLGLEGTFAEEELRDLIEVLQDRLSKSQISVPLHNQKNIPASLRKLMDPCPQLPLPSDDPIPADSNEQVAVNHTKCHDIFVLARTWASVGKAILHQMGIESQANTNAGLGSYYRIVLPGRDQSFTVPRSTSTIMPALPQKQSSLNTSPILMTPHAEGGSRLGEDMERSNIAITKSGTCVTTDGFAASRPVVIDKLDTNMAVSLKSHSGDPTLHDNMAPALICDTVSSNTMIPHTSQLEQEPTIVTHVISLPTRKRSSESAGLQESGEGARVRSKRIRARAESGVEEENTAVELARYYEERLQIYTQADHWVFEVVGGFLSRLGIRGLGSLAELKQAISVPEMGTPNGSTSTRESNVAGMKALKAALLSWDLDKSNLFLHGDGSDDAMAGFHPGRNSGLAVFLEYSKQGSQRGPIAPGLSGDDGLLEFQNKVNQSWTYLEELAILWVVDLLDPKNREDEHDDPEGSWSGARSRYISYSWPDTLKETVVQMLVKEDEHIFLRLRTYIESLDELILSATSGHYQYIQSSEDEDMIEVVQTIFELHLDIYGRITNPSSEVDEATRTMQRDRLGRWAALASQAMSKRRSRNADESISDTLFVRHLWSSVIYIDLTEVTSRDHVILCLQDLKRILEETGSPVIELQNNAIMPELSVEAIEREIARLTTMDFFLSIFDVKSNDPLAVIESLEPILECSSIDRNNAPQLDGSSSVDSPNRSSDQGNQGSTTFQREHIAELGVTKDPRVQQMIDFLDKASITLRLFLWRRLRIAYETLVYPSMVFSCYLRSVELITKYLRTLSYSEDTPDSRVTSLLRWLRVVDDLVGKALTLSLQDSSAFECIDEERLRAAMESCAELVRLLHTFALWEDSTRVGQSQAPGQLPGLASTAYTASMNKFREMQVRVWMLQYVLLKEAMVQNPSLFPTPKEDLADYLKLLHYAFGVRQYCQLSKKIFLKFMKDELLELNASERWEADMAQVVFDLNGLKVCPNYHGLQDHGCTPENLDRRSALGILNFVISQAQTVNVRDLLKTDLKSAIDRMQQVIGTPKQSGSQLSNTQLFNKRLITAYLKAPVNPVQLYRSLQGIGDLAGTRINNEYSMIADKGWYFLLGHITLAKFKSQKRVSPGPTDDLDFAMTFFRLDLEFGMEKWETWYRLAQVCDAKIEEDTTWNAIKIRNQKAELNVLQRNAIHCYAMAVAVAIRCADASFDTASKISELYFDFGTRIYASSREPFSMEAFDLEDFARYYSGESVSMYKSRPFRALQQYSAWNLASVLFRRALVDQPQRWINWYMLGKCLWKMYTYDALKPEKAKSVDFHEALDAFSQAIEYVPERRDSRHPDKDPILEPHYKLASVVHKLVQRRRVLPAEGCRILETTPYARKVPHVQDFEEWEGYILYVLKALRSADKSNWHHRMVARAAHIIYDDSPNNIMAAAAKLELTQQIFTKTMTIQVWKPENERAGRHFVYTARYVSFFVRILFHMGDRASLEALAKRIRKKTSDFTDHSRIWQEICMAYLKLLRHAGEIPEGHEDTVFKSIPHDTFTINTTRLETWAHSPDTTSPLLDLLREIIELKKLNNNLMKSTLIDDLVGDTFALLYEKHVPNLIAKSNDEENRDRMRVDHLLMNPDISLTTTTDAPSPAPSGEQPAAPPLSKPRPKAVGRREIQKRAESLISLLLSKPSFQPQPQPPSVAAAAAAAATTPKTPKQPPPAFLMPPTITTTTTTTSPSALHQHQHQQSHTSLPPTSAGSADTTAPLSTNKHKQQHQQHPQDGPTPKDAMTISSVPGSVHDSADDESELSDIEEVVAEAEAENEGEGPGECVGEGEDEGEGEAEEETEEEKGGGGGEPKPMFPGLLDRKGLGGEEEDVDMEEEGSVGAGVDVDIDVGQKEVEEEEESEKKGESEDDEDDEDGMAVESASIYR